MNRFVVLLIAAVTGLVLFSSSMTLSASAVNVATSCDGSASNTDVCKGIDEGTTSDNPVIKALKLVIDVVSYIVGVMAVIIIVISGIRMTTSRGDAQGVAQARSAIIYALIAIVVAVMAKVIVGFILSSVG